MKGYKTIRDYRRLKELLDNGYEVVCFTTYDFLQGREEKPMMTTDICRAKLIDKDGEYPCYIVGVRGCTYITYYLRGMNYKYSFEDICKQEQIEFIDPIEE